MQFGQHLVHLEELAEESPDNIPAALLTQPELLPHQELFRLAFLQLNSGREIAIGLNGNVIQALSLADCFLMADEIGADRMHFLRVIRPLDALYREAINRRAK